MNSAVISGGALEIISDLEQKRRRSKKNANKTDLPLTVMSTTGSTHQCSSRTMQATSHRPLSVETSVDSDSVQVILSLLFNWVSTFKKFKPRLTLFNLGRHCLTLSKV